MVFFFRVEHRPLIVVNESSEVYADLKTHIRQVWDELANGPWPENYFADNILEHQQGSPKDTDFLKHIGIHNAHAVVTFGQRCSVRDDDERKQTPALVDKNNILIGIALEKALDGKAAMVKTSLQSIEWYS